MKLLAVISHKGGAGKTTSAVMLAEELAERGYRVVLVDADRQQSGALLLDLAGADEGIHETRISNLDYFASARLAELEVEDRCAELAGSYDVCVVDTPSLDDELARAWLSEADAALVVVQVEPLTMKTMHAALATVETVRRVNRNIQVLGLLPTMYDERQETHRILLSELVQRRRDSLFPAIPTDPGLMHRAGMSWAAEVSTLTRDAYWAVADRIVATMDLTVGPAAPAVAPPAPAPAMLRMPSVPVAAGAGERRRRNDERATPLEESPSYVVRRANSSESRPRGGAGWGRVVAPFALGFAGALLVLALVLGPLRTRLFPSGTAYAVPSSHGRKHAPKLKSGGNATSANQAAPEEPAVARKQAAVRKDPAADDGSRKSDGAADEQQEGTR